jgi:hypothetical protein
MTNQRTFTFMHDERLPQPLVSEWTINMQKVCK